ncbi:alpha/beta hydrolase [Sphingopyxis sp.]|uniref:alpha/beta fold hydrolase n=1 Tax=Sphingopyxis sp. TaxID=1908224 RepID=UPI0025FBA0DD|nr:alpha/beta hydrolase [Sphingopyxis sp.]MBK6411482.1 hypothetical protein [Sphingopyxis sp.]
MDQRGYLPKLEALPTLVLTGERDGVMPACYGQMLASLIDGSGCWKVVPGSHLFPFTHAAAICGADPAFLVPARQRGEA